MSFKDDTNKGVPRGADPACMPVPPLALTLALTLVLAGCAGQEPATRASAPPSPPIPGPTPASESTTAPVGKEPSHRVVTKAWNGSVTAVAVGTSGAVSICCPTIVSDGENVEGAFTVEPNATALLVELVWADTLFDLDLAIYAPDHEFVSPPELNGTRITSSRGHSYYDTKGQIGSPDGHAAILLTQPEDVSLAGEWTWWIPTKSANGVAFTIHVTSFYGEPPLAGYTAVPP